MKWPSKSFLFIICSFYSVVSCSAINPRFLSQHRSCCYAGSTSIFLVGAAATAVFMDISAHRTRRDESKIGCLKREGKFYYFVAAIGAGIAGVAGLIATAAA